jgi:hypothetical protein
LRFNGFHVPFRLSPKLASFAIVSHSRSRSVLRRFGSLVRHLHRETNGSYKSCADPESRGPEFRTDYPEAIRLDSNHSPTRIRQNAYRQVFLLGLRVGSLETFFVRFPPPPRRRRSCGVARSRFRSIIASETYTMKPKNGNCATIELANNRDMSGMATANEVNRDLQTEKESHRCKGGRHGP